MMLSILMAAIIGLRPMAGDNTAQVVEAVSRLGDGDTLRFEKGEYHFHEKDGKDLFLASPGSQTGMKKVLVHLKGLKDVTVDGGDSHFVFHENIFPFVFENCERVKLRGFTSDVAQLSVVEFVCEEKSKEGFLCRFTTKTIPYAVDDRGVITFTFDGGSVSSESQEISTHALKWCQIHYLCGPSCRRNKDTLASTFFTARAEDRGDGRVFFRYFDEKHPKHVDEFPFRTGAPLAFLLGCSRNRSLASIHDCRGVTVEDVHVRTGVGMGLVMDMCEDVRICRYNVRPEDGSFVSLTADTMYLVDCKGLIEIDGCEISWAMDDALNIHGNYTELKGVEGRRIRVRHPHHAYNGYFPYRSGERLEFSRGYGSRRETLGEATIAVFKAPADREAREFEIELDRTIPAEWLGCDVANRSHVPKIHIHDCNFHDFMHVRLSAFADVVFENNRIDNGNSALLVDDLTGYWGECGPVHDLTVRNNEIVGIRHKCFDIRVPITGRAVFENNRLPERFRNSPFNFGPAVSEADRRKFLVKRPVPPPVIRAVDLRTNETAVAVEKTERVTASNGLYRFVETSFAFANPNPRALSADFEFPIPEGATVCGYRLEVNGEMVPGIVCEKEKARVAFENEQRKGVDPGIVEHVKGNVWKTRIFPLPANGTRKAEVTYVVAEDGAELKVSERCGAWVYEGERRADLLSALSAPADRCKSCAEGWVLWDASLSRKGKTAADVERLRTLPAKGAWKLVVFRDVPSTARTFTSRDELVAAVTAEPCDGGTDLAALLKVLPEDGQPKLLFSDEIDTLGEKAPELEARADFVFASRPAPKVRRVTVTRRLAKPGESVAEGRLLATAWAANRIADLESQAEARKDEFLALGREFGVASPVTSLLVLETLQQWLDNKIEPPRELSIHDEWVKRRATADDPIARKREQADFEERLLTLWEERVTWCKDPKPKVKKPSSGLFARAASAVANAVDGLAGVRESRAAMRSAPVAADGMVALSEEAAAPARKSEKAEASGAAKSAAATVTLAAWDPKTPYVDALKAAKPADAYAEYLRQAEKFGQSPAFYLDCAGWFFKAGFRELALRIISNLAEFRLEDAALWRTMGWRLREAGAFDEAVRAFRHALALRGEEGQSRRDLALVLCERGKERFAQGRLPLAHADLTEALKLFHEASFTNYARRSARRSNDLQVSVLALEELNGLLAWCAAQDWKAQPTPVAPTMDEAYRRDLPMDLRIILSWDADETDIDIHVLEPNGEEAFYGNRRTQEGGFVGEDVTTGYGPEEYLRKDAEKGVYKVLSNYFASHQQALTGAATVTATVYTNWSRKDEKRQTLTLRLDKPKDKHSIGEVRID